MCVFECSKKTSSSSPPVYFALQSSYSLSFSPAELHCFDVTARGLHNGTLRAALKAVHVFRLFAPHGLSDRHYGHGHWSRDCDSLHHRTSLAALHASYFLWLNRANASFPPSATRPDLGNNDYHSF